MEKIGNPGKVATYAKNRYEILERNTSRKQIKPSVALEILANELEKEAEFLLRHDQALTESAENILYAAVFIRTHFVDDDGRALLVDASLTA